MNQMGIPFVPKYTGEDKLKELGLEAEEAKELLERKRLKVEERRVKAMERMAKSNMSLFLLAFLKDLSPYIVLVVIIFIVILLSKGKLSTRPLRRLDAKRKKEFARAKSRWYRIKQWFLTKFLWVRNILTPSYRVRLILNMLMPFGGKNNQIPRQRIMSGRCDNHRWIQVNEKGEYDVDMDGRRGYCFSAIRPKDIEWELDMSRMPDFHDLPEEAKKDFQKMKNVVIPYDTEDTVKDGNTFFVPRCDKAYFKDFKDERGQPKKVTMLEDTGTSCKLASHSMMKGQFGVTGKTKKELIHNTKM
jgi:hypothetical protein